MEFVWIVLILVGFILPIIILQLLVQRALERKGNWLTFVEVLNGICGFVAGIALLFALTIGAGRLWERSAWAFVGSAGALAFVIYFYIAKVDARENEKRKDELTPKQALKIVQQYGAALARGVPKGSIARYESYLPCSKERIKQAFKLILAYHIEYCSLTKDTSNLLIGAVSYLNAFVPDEKADRMNGIYANRLWPGDEEVRQFRHDMPGAEIWAEMEDFIAAVEVLDRDENLFHQRVYTLIGLEYSERIEKAYRDAIWDD